ncbi:MAG TPA: MFS transporter [Streptosporangiales bacterium]
MGVRTGGSRAWLTVGAVAGGLFLAVLSTTLVSVALPAIGRGLDASATDLQWVVDAYVIVYASLLVAGGVLGDRVGRKGVFLLGVGLFAAGALGCGVAPSVPVLLAGRVVQGLGPALLVPGSLTIIRTTFEDARKRALAIGLWSTASGLSLAAGPALGGVVVAGLGWRWVFLLNVPLAGILLAVAARVVPRLEANPPGARFDWGGTVLTTVAVASLTAGIIHGQTAGPAAASVLGAFAVGVAAAAALVLWERRCRAPLVDLSLFARPAFVAANVAALVVFFSFVGAIVYFSGYFQQVQGRTPVTSGLDVSAIGVAFALAAPLSGRLVGRVGPLPPMLAGLVVGGLATLGLLRLEPDTGIRAIWWDFVLVGAGIGACLTPMTHTALSAVGRARAGMASAVHNAFRQFGQVLGVAVLGLQVYADVSARGAVGGRLGHADGRRFVDGLHHGVLLSGVALLAAAGLVAVLSLLQRSRRRDPRRDAAR